MARHPINCLFHLQWHFHIFIAIWWLRYSENEDVSGDIEKQLEVGDSISIILIREVSLLIILGWFEIFVIIINDL